MSFGTFSGTGRLIRLALRLDRILLPIWVLALSGIVIGSTSQIAGIYPDEASRRELATGFGQDPTAAAMYGPGFDLSTIGGIVAWRYSMVATVFVPLLCLFLVIRHTRVEEEAGRADLLGAAVVGRRATLTAALTVAFTAAALVGLLIALGLIGRGEPAAGALAFGAATMAGGWMFAAVAAVTAQLSTYARPARGIAIALLGGAFLIRAAGDAADVSGSGPGWLSWLSPLGWLPQVRAFAGERWWVFVLPVAFIAVLVAASYALVERRDVGSGLLPGRLGPAAASHGLSSPFGLAWRLQRGSLLAWSLGLFISGAVFGSLAAGMEDLVKDSPGVLEQLERLGGSGSLADSFLATILLFLGMIAAAYAVQAALRLRAEETGQRAEPVLAAALTRTRWAAGHLVFAVVAAVIPLLAAGLGTGLAHGVRTHDLSGKVPRVLGAALVQLPAVWFFAGVALALFGLVPRLASTGAWTFMAAAAVLGLYGPVLELGQPIIDLSAFAHIPRAPGVDVTFTPLLWLTGVAAALFTFRRRDIPG